MIVSGLSNRSTRFYDANGNAIHSVVGKNGKERSINLAWDRDLIAKEKWRPSVTSVLKLLAKEHLVNWRIEQAILSCRTLPMLDGESEQDFVARVLQDMDAQSEKARKKGSAIHYAIENYCDYCTDFASSGGTRKFSIPDHEFAPQIRAFKEFCDEHQLTNLQTEVVLIGDDCAGRCDILADSPEGPTVIDTKSQDKDKFVFYNDVLYQLGAYAHIKNDPHAMRGITFVVHRDAEKESVAKWDSKIWSVEEVRRGMKVFRGLLQSYLAINKLDIAA